MTTAVDVLLAECRKERGYTECPRDLHDRCIYAGHTGPGQNHQKFAVEAHLTNGTFWCGAYTSALLIRTKADVPPGVLTLSTRMNLAAWKKAGRFVSPSQIQPGDVVFYHLTGRNGSDHSIPDHTGFCIEAPANGKLLASEGNTSNSEYGSQDNGGGVFDRTRAMSLVIGAGRPIYPAPAPPLPPQEDDDMPFVANPVTDTDPGEYLVVGNTMVPLGSQDEAQQLRNSGFTTRDIEPAAWALMKATLKEIDHP